MNSKITVISEYSFIPSTLHKVEIVSNHIDSKSIISYSLNYNGTSNKEEVEIEGKDNFSNLIDAITSFDRTINGAFYIPYEGMKQNLNISKLDKWKENYLIFCLGGNEETNECYAKKFTSLNPIQLEKIFDNINIFDFITLYEEINSLLEKTITKHDINAWFKFYHETELYNFYNLREKILNYENVDDLLKQKQITKHNEYIKSFEKYLKNVKYDKISGAAPGPQIHNSIARQSILYFIEYYLRKYNKVPKGEYHISYVPYDSIKAEQEGKQKVKKYEDFKSKENNKIFFL